MSLGRLVVSLTAETAQFHQALDRASFLAQKSFDKITGSAKSAAIAIGAGFSGIQIGQAFQKIISEAEQAQTNLLRTQALLTATGGVVGQTAQSLVQQAKNLSAATLQSTEDVQRAQQILLTYTNIVGTNFDRALELAADLSSLMGTSLPSAVETFAKALDSPVERLSALTRVGFNFTEQQKDQIKTLVESNKLFEAQQIILDVASKSFGGLAKEEAQGYAGAQKQLAEAVKDAADEIEKQFGLLDKSTQVIRGMAESVTGLTNFIVENKTSIFIWTAALGSAGLLAILPKVVSAMYALSAAVVAVSAAFLANPVALAILAITAAAIPAVQQINRLAEAKRNLAKAAENKELDAFTGRLQKLMAVIKQRQAGQATETKQNEDVKKTINSLSNEYYALFLTRAQLLGIELAGKKATQAEIDSAKALVGEIEKVVEARKKEKETKEKADQIDKDLTARGASVFNETRTAQEALNIKLEEYNELLNASKISVDTWRRATTSAQQEIYNQQESVRDSLYEGLLTEEEQIMQSYTRRKAMILTLTKEGSTERKDLLTRLEEQTNEKLSELNQDYWSKWLKAAEESLTDYDELSKNVVNSATERFGTLFEDVITGSQTAGEAFREFAASMARSVINAAGQMIAQWLAYKAVQATIGSGASAGAATAKTAEAAMAQQMAGLNAFASTAAIPVVGPGLAPAAAAAAIAATTPMVGAVASLAAASFAGAFDKGGMIPSGKWGIVGEYGPEIVQGPASVTSRTDTAEMMKRQTNIRIVNAFDSQVISDYIGSDAGEEVVMNIVKRNQSAIRGLVTT